MQFLFIDQFPIDSEASRRDIVEVNNLNKQQEQQTREREAETATKTATREAKTPNVLNYRYSSRATLANTPNKIDIQQAIASQVANIGRPKKKQCAAVIQQESKEDNKDNSIITITIIDIVLKCSTTSKKTNLIRELLKSATTVRLPQFQPIKYCYSY